MHYLQACLLLCVLASINLNAGVPRQIDKDSPAQKEMGLSIEHKNSPQDQNNVMITVVLKGGKSTTVTLVIDGKNVELTTQVNENGMASLSFEIEKKHIEQGFLHITGGPSDAKCGEQYLLYLKGYVV